MRKPSCLILKKQFVKSQDEGCEALKGVDNDLITSAKDGLIKQQSSRHCGPVEVGEEGQGGVSSKHISTIATVT